MLKSVITNISFVFSLENKSVKAIFNLSGNIPCWNDALKSMYNIFVTDSRESKIIFPFK